MSSEGNKTVCVQISYRLYKELKSTGIVMSRVMRNALEQSVGWNDKQ